MVFLWHTYLRARLVLQAVLPVYAQTWAHHGGSPFKYIGLLKEGHIPCNFALMHTGLHVLLKIDPALKKERATFRGKTLAMQLHTTVGETGLRYPPRLKNASCTLIFKNEATAAAAINGTLDAGAAIGSGALTINGLVPLAEAAEPALLKLERLLK